MRWGSEIDDAREVAVRQETGTFALAAASDGRDNPPLKSDGAGFARWKQAKHLRPHKLRAKD